jgi:hypothetical protein
MKLRLCAYGVAILASVTLPAVAATLAHAAECQDLTWPQDRLSKFDVAVASEQDAVKRQGPARQAAHWPQDQVSEVNAAIASLEQDVATRRGDAAAKGAAVLNEVRAGRDAYRIKLQQLATHMMAAAEAADARQSPEEAANAFWAKVDAYLDAVNADIPARQAATQTRFMGN